MRLANNLLRGGRQELAGVLRALEDEYGDGGAIDATNPSVAAYSLLELDWVAKPLPEDSEKDGCTVCETNFRDVTFVPCGHFCVCVDCARKIGSRVIATEAAECPLCRAKITNATRTRI